MNEDDDFGIDPEIAASMGFSGFGAQPSSKRRKFNDDAIIEGQIKEPRVQKQGSGANTTSLGIRKNPKGALDSTMESTEAAKAESTPKKTKKEKQSAPSGLAAFLSRGQTLPARPPIEASDSAQVSDPASSVDVPFTKPAAIPSQTAGQHHGHEDLAAYRRGVKNERGDMAYFLPSFLEDPWKDLRKSKSGG